MMWCDKSYFYFVQFGDVSEKVRAVQNWKTLPSTGSIY